MKISGYVLRLAIAGTWSAVALLSSACEQDPPLAYSAGDNAQIELEIHYGSAAKTAANDNFRVLVWHVTSLQPLPQPAGKRSQFPGIDFDPNEWLAWASYLAQVQGFDNIPERNATLSVQPAAGVARGSLRVRAGEKYIFIGRFRGGELTHTGQARVIALPARVNKHPVVITPFSTISPLEFASAALRAALREAAGSLLPSDLLALTTLDLSGRGIDDLSGIEQLSGLTSLDLSGNDIEDTSLLSALSGLSVLDLSGNRIVDIASLALLRQLVRLDLSDNLIADAQALSGLPLLEVLDLRGNPLSLEQLLEQIPDFESDVLEDVLVDQVAGEETPEVPDISRGDFADTQVAAEVARELVRNFTTDITKLTDLDLGGKGVDNLNGIQYLSGLSELTLAGNDIDDLSPLAGLTELEEVNLRNNQITDISPLVANPGLGEGDRVDLRGNDLSDEAIAVQIPALQERGVEVLYDED